MTKKDEKLPSWQRVRILDQEKAYVKVRIDLEETNLNFILF